MSLELPTAIILRIGIDAALGGVWAPIFIDNSFEYIPYPDSPGLTYPTLRTKEQLSNYGVMIEAYRDIKARSSNSKTLSNFLPNDRLRVRGEYWRGPSAIVPHHDPNFQFRTFGDFWKDGNGGRLPKNWYIVDPDRLALRIFFVQTLASMDEEAYLKDLTFNFMSKFQKANYGMYIVGQLEVEQIIDIKREGGWLKVLNNRQDCREKIVHNMHFKRQGVDHSVIVVGNKNTALFNRPLALKEIINGQTKITSLGKILGVSKGDMIRLKWLRQAQSDLIFRKIDEA